MEKKQYDAAIGNQKERFTATAKANAEKNEERITKNGDDFAAATKTFEDDTRLAGEVAKTEEDRLKQGSAAVSWAVNKENI